MVMQRDKLNYCCNCRKNFNEKEKEKTKVCISCGETFLPKQKDRLYCYGNGCQQYRLSKMNKKKKKKKSPTRTRETKIITIHEEYNRKINEVTKLQELLETIKNRIPEKI